MNFWQIIRFLFRRHRGSCGCRFVVVKKWKHAHQQEQEKQPQQQQQPRPRPQPQQQTLLIPMHKLH